MIKPFYYLILFGLLSSFLFGASAQQSYPDSSRTVVLRIDPASAKGGAVSDVFSEVEFIPLETTKESLFGYILHLEIIDDCFVLYDADTKAVYIFEQNGKFKTKIDSKVLKAANGKKYEYTQGFAVSRLDGKNLITIETDKNMLYFDTNAKLIKKTALKSNKINGEYLKTYFNSGYVQTNYIQINKKDSTIFDLATFNQNKITGKYFPAAKDKYLNGDSYIADGCGIFDFDAVDKLFFLRPHDYHIYLATPDKLLVAYKFIFPLNKMLPADFLTPGKYKGFARMEYLAHNGEIIYGLGNSFLAGNKLFFTAKQMNTGTDAKSALMYNLKNGDLTSIADLQPDALSQFLPITDDKLGNDFEQRNFLVFYKGNMYTSYSSLTLFNVKEQRNGKKTKYNAALTKLFKEGSINDNPIIIRLKPTKN
ncbi:hypothetical protein ACVWYG_001433 [Pedobacter sp. UYEF25]